MPIPKNLICFLHGKKTGPECDQIKILSKTALKKGYEVLSTDFTTTVDPDERLEMLLEVSPKAIKNLVLVGLSMGSYAAAVASKTLKPRGMFLLSSAFYLQGYAHQDPVPIAEYTTLVHGWNDTVVPVENAINFARKHQTELIVLNTDHFLEGAMPRIDSIFSTFLEQLQ